MKASILVAMFAFAFLISDVPSARAQTPPPPQNFDGKVILPSTFGDLICLGGWDAESRRCNGAQVSSGGLAALSAMRSAEALERIQALLDTMSKTLSENTEAVLSIENSIEQQNRQAGESLRQAVAKKVDAVAETVDDDSVKEALQKLKNDLLREIDRENPKPAAESGR
ncbi:MAG: hypothetical protein EPO39_16395 [Candidatus Manganitrophaceae bacterium]|nr:MAG: hypothetical protein EPO39_16395 [Candidatus Manganitrophaceae bacterium]